MGLFNLLMKHGPGSIGSISKTLSQNYTKFKKENPSASENELLRMIIVSRMRGHSALGLKPISSVEMENWIRESEGHLKFIITRIINFENPATRDFLLKDYDLWENMHTIIEDNMRQYAPAAK